MSRPFALGLAAALAMTVPAVVMAAEAAYSSKSLIGDLLDNPETKAVLLKHIPNVVNDPMIEQGRGFPLEGIVQFVPELTPEVLAKIDADLAKVQKK